MLLHLRKQCISKQKSGCERLRSTAGNYITTSRLETTIWAPQERPAFACGGRTESSHEGQGKWNSEGSGLCLTPSFASETGVNTFDITGLSIPYHLQDDLMLVP